MSRSTRRFLAPAIAAATIFAALPLLAEVSSRECILLSPYDYPNHEGTAYLVPGTSATLLSHQVNIYTASNAVIAAQIFFPDSAQPVSQRARYAILVDGSTANMLTPPAQYYNRTPFITQGTTSVRAFYVSLSAGTHTITLNVNNTSGTTLWISGAYMSTMFVEPTEATAQNENNSTQSIGSGFTTIGQFTIPSAPNHHMFVSSYIRASAAGTVTFQYLVNGIEVEQKVVNFHGVDDGAMIDYLIQNVVPGQSVVLQASGPATVTVVEMAAQETEQYSVMELKSDTTGSVSAPIFSLAEITPTMTPVILNTLSLSGPPGGGNTGNATCQWGTSDTLLAINPASEIELHLQPWQSGTCHPSTPCPASLFGDMGVAGYSPDSAFASYHQQSDWGCGITLYSGTGYYAKELVNDLCSNKTVNYGHRRLQFLVLPAPCSGNCGPWTQGGAEDLHTCTQPSLNCTWTCTNSLTSQDISSSLQKFCS